MSEALAIHPGDPALLEREPETRASGTIPPSAVRQQLDRILQSRAFARSPRISRFLSFVVDQTLAGQEDKLKEYLLGVEVFNRMDSFDPRIDSIVRVEARRLRYKLDRYYETEGRDDTVHIQFRKGCYVPTFGNKTAGEQPAGDVFQFPHLHIIEDPHAFALYAKGRANLGRWTPDGIAESISCFSQAVLENRECAKAHAGLASAWTLASLLGLMPARDVLAKARKSAGDAIKIQPDCAEAHAVEGVVAALQEFEWNDAENRLRRAIPMDPCCAETRLWYGLYALLAGRTDDAVRELRKAQHAFPTSITTHMASGFALHLAKSYDEALLQYRLAHDLNPSSYAPHLAMGLLFTEQRMFEQAQHSMSQAAQFSPRNPNIMAALTYTHAVAGRADAARQVADELRDLASRQHVPALCLCLANAATGDREAAIQKLEEAYEERSPWLGLVRLMPAFSSIRDDSRYPALTARIGLA
jgi:tetratricopeptide (TPR) repeat protein